MDSKVGEGTIVRFDIPARVVGIEEFAPTAPRMRALALAPGQPAFRILVVDDSRDARQLLVRLLAPLGFELREAGDGQEALDLWNDWQPQLILMDVRMPVMDGYETTRRIKAHARGAATKIVILTASSFDAGRLALAAAGCDDYLRKPFRDDDIYATLQRHLGVRFVYEEEPRVARATLEVAALAALPAEPRAALERAIQQLDVAAVTRALAEVRRYDEPLARALSAAADNFQYEHLLRVIERAGHPRSESG